LLFPFNLQHHEEVAFRIARLGIISDRPFDDFTGSHKDSLPKPEWRGITSDNQGWNFSQQKRDVEEIPFQIALEPRGLNLQGASSS
jgi:hypothetical protein